MWRAWLRTGMRREKWEERSEKWDEERREEREERREKWEKWEMGVSERKRKKERIATTTKPLESLMILRVFSIIWTKNINFHTRFLLFGCRKFIFIVAHKKLEQSSWFFTLNKQTNEWITLSKKKLIKDNKQMRIQSCWRCSILFLLLAVQAPIDEKEVVSSSVLHAFLFCWKEPEEKMIEFIEKEMSKF